MKRKNLTQIFPFLLPIRKKQKKIVFYTKMALDKNKYAEDVRTTTMPHTMFETSSLLRTQDIGSEIAFEKNKIHNLKVAAKALDGLVIKPGETFSFYRSIKRNVKKGDFKKGPDQINGEIVPSYGGGLCQLSNLLFWMFLHTPLDILERHSYIVQSRPMNIDERPLGVEASVTEGWSDLKMENNTFTCFQINIDFDDDRMHGIITSDMDHPHKYEIYNENLNYFLTGKKVYQEVNVNRINKHKKTGRASQKFLYKNTCEIKYPLDDDTSIREKEPYRIKKESSNLVVRNVTKVRNFT